MNQQLFPELVKTIEEFRKYLNSDEGKHQLNYLKAVEPDETRKVLEKLNTLSSINVSREVRDFVTVNFFSIKCHKVTSPLIIFCFQIIHTNLYSEWYTLQWLKQ